SKPSEKCQWKTKMLPKRPKILTIRKQCQRRLWTLNFSQKFKKSSWKNLWRSRPCFGRRSKPSEKCQWKTKMLPKRPKILTIRKQCQRRLWTLNFSQKF
ncbi:unnamed protein product, partial [Durusdinium trenchii]